ncbi:hypothetical protein [Amycolatopsis albispora]|uniref:ABC transporter n=1 Tax=Amycolatopsis albispora TaxID=1804986 RepID=A0A344L9D1_9PSEU|nr:hypothetical protein [Amycolatopsis albispora]AXB44655.1 hypothetical protein A4R43_20880 [Amycolatopsis albispora]
MTWPLVRYYSADLLRSQRFLLPFLLYGMLLAPLFGGDPGPPPGTWAASVLALYPVSVWLAVTVANTEDPVQRQVTIAAAGGRGRVTTGILLTCLLADLVLVALALGWPVLATAYEYPPHLLAAGVLAHFAAGATGTAVGLLCARPVVHGIGWSAVLGATVVAATGFQRWLPPVGEAARTLVDTPVSLSTLGFDAGLALALAVAAAVVVSRVRAT